MHIIAVRYVLMKSISVGLTLVLVKNDSDILWIPILDILSSLWHHFNAVKFAWWVSRSVLWNPSREAGIR